MIQFWRINSLPFSFLIPSQPLLQNYISTSQFFIIHSLLICLLLRCIVSCSFPLPSLRNFVERLNDLGITDFPQIFKEFIRIFTQISAYEEGRFCETFHSNEKGWRKCVACGKRVHCGCVVSINKIILLETFGVACLNCAMNSSTMEPNQCDSPSWSTTLAEFVHNTGSPCEVEQSNNSDKVNGSKCEANAVAKSGQSPFHDTPSQMKAPLPNGHPRGNAAGKKGLGAKYQPRINDHVIQQISRDLNSVVTPLFEKTLTSSDADCKLGRLVIPKKCAREYFPVISGPEGVTIRVLDTKGREWEFHYQYWSNVNSLMYVLDGLKDFIISMQWQAGDIVTFYRMEPDGQLVLGLRKASVTPPSHKCELKELIVPGASFSRWAC